MSATGSSPASEELDFKGVKSLLPLDSKAGLPEGWPKDGIYVFPEAKRDPWLKAIQKATDSIQMAAYRLSDPEIILALEAALKKGVKVFLLVEPEPMSHERSDNVVSPIEELKKMGAGISTTPSDFKQVHHKMIIIDGKWAMVGTGNLDKESFDGLQDKVKNEQPTRDFTITLTRPDLLEELKTVFEADTKQQKIPPTQSQLIWGPDGQRKAFLGMINGAEKTIQIYQQSIQDEGIAKALAEAAGRGVKVEILMMEDPFGMMKKGKQDPNLTNQELITKAGGTVYFNQQHYIHAKVMIIDGKLMYIGSCNFYPSSIDETRELGVLTVDESQIIMVQAVHQEDIKHSKALTLKK